MKKIILSFLISVTLAKETLEWTSNQTKVFYVKNTEIPMVDIAIAFHAGSRYAAPGLANLTANSSRLGSKFLNKEQVDAKLSSVGSELRAYVDKELIVYHLRSLSDVPEEKIVDQFNSAIFNAAFPSQEIGPQRQYIISELAFEQAQPEEVAQKHLYKLLFPSAPRFNSSVYGYADTLENFHTSDLLQHHARLMNQYNSTIIMVGNISEENAKSLAEHLSKKLRPSESTLTKEHLSKLNEPQTISIKPEQPQTYFLFSTKIPASSTKKEFVSYLLLNEMLGGNSSSYLFQTLRDKESLVYSVNSHFDGIDDFALLSISGQSKTKNIGHINKLLENAFNQQQETILTQKRFEIAKKSLKNKLFLESRTNKDKLQSIINLAKNNHPVDYDTWLTNTLSTITIKDVTDALKTIHANQFYKVYVGC